MYISTDTSHASSHPFGDNRSVKPQATSLSLSTQSLQLFSEFVTFIGFHRKPAGPATTQTCSVRPWERWGQPRLSALRDTERAEGIVTIIPTFCLKPLIQFIIFLPMLYKLPVPFASQMCCLLNSINYIYNDALTIFSNLNFLLWKCSEVVKWYV